MVVSRHGPPPRGSITQGKDAGTVGMTAPASSRNGELDRRTPILRSGTKFLEHPQGSPSAPLSIAEQLGDDTPGMKVYDFAKTRRMRRLSNGEVLERVARFLRTGDRHHLPPQLRPEAEGIEALALHVLLTEEIPPWPSGAARPHPGPGASIGDLVRAMVGDEVADADSELEDDDDADGVA